MLDANMDTELNAQLCITHTAAGSTAIMVVIMAVLRLRR